MARFRNRRTPTKKSEESSEPKVEETIEETADEATEETVEAEEETAITQEEVIEETKATPDPIEPEAEPITTSEGGKAEENLKEEEERVEPAEGAQNPEPIQGTETPVSGKKRTKPKKVKADKKKKDEKPMAGLIFMCNEKTKQECFKFRIFGLPETKASVVERVTPGMKLFLFNVPDRQLYGVYEASSPGGLDLDTEAFKESGSDKGFPAQVRFRIMKDCLPLSEATFRPAIRENYFMGNKFRNELTAEQVEKLTKLFRPLKEAAKEVAAAAKASTATTTPVKEARSKAKQQLKKPKQEKQERMSGKKNFRSDSRPQRRADFSQQRQRGGGRAPQPPPQQRRFSRPPRPRPLPAYAANPVVVPRDSYYATPYAVEAGYAQPAYVQRPVVDPYLEAVSTLTRKRAYEDAAYLSSDYLLAAPKRAHLQDLYPADYSRSAAYSSYLRY